VDATGNVYGTTSGGGVHFNGTLFELSPDGEETILYNFLGIYGQDPESALFRDAKGTFYGTTEGGGTSNWGTVFKVPGKGKDKVLYSFPENDGAPYSAVIRDAHGNLYGSTFGTSNRSCGVAFKLSPAGKETTLYIFTGRTDGCGPIGSLIRDAAGNLYGVAYAGGDASCMSPYGCGVVFKLDTAGNETVLYTFTGGSDGARPVGIVRDKDGTFYGATAFGGISSCVLFGVPGCGTVFKLDATGQETVLYSFTNTNGDGAGPAAGVVLDPAGNIYGSTSIGGNDDYGVVFMLDTSGKETILHSFTGGADGAEPSGVVLDAAGNIYGTTPEGGDSNCWFWGRPGCGTVFKITP